MSDADLQKLYDEADAYYKKGNYQKALELDQECYLGRLKLLGESNVDTLKSLNALAIDYSLIRDYNMALELTEKCYKLKVDILGQDHPDTLRSLHNLAILYSKIGDFNKALELTEKCYKIRVDILGQEHPDTLSSLINLAIRYSYIGEYNKALKLTEKCYKLYVDILGQNHPDTLNSLNDLALLYSKTGDYTKALELTEKCYKLYVDILGQNHPYTLISLNNLVSYYAYIGDYNKALELAEKCYKLRVDILGQDHPDTLMSLNNLANSYSNIGDYNRALELTEKCYKLYVDTLGQNHLDTLMSLNNLANRYSNIGDFNKALELTEKCYKLRVDILGQNHSDTLMSLNNLASSYSDIGDYNKALVLAEKCYKLRVDILGQNHPDTLISLNNLAIWYYDIGDYNKALVLAEKCYKLRVDILGQEHPNTQKTNNLLESLRDKLGIIDLEGIRNSLNKYKLHINEVDFGKKDIEYVKKIKTYISFYDYFDQQIATTIETSASKDSKTVHDELQDFNNQYLSFIHLFFNEDFSDSFTKDYTILLKTKNIFFDIDKDRQQFTLLPNVQRIYNEINYKNNVLKQETNQNKIQELNQGIKKLYEELADLSKERNLQKTINKVTLENIQNFLNDLEVIIDIYVLESRSIFVVYSKYEDPREFILEDDFTSLKDYLYENQINKAYICADGYYYNEQFESVIPFDSLHISSIRSLFEIDYCVAFTDPDFGDRWKKVSTLLGSRIEGRIFDDLFEDSTNYTGNSVTKQFITSIKNPKILHIATHGFYDPSIKDINKRTGLIMSDYNNHILDKEYHILYPSDVEKMDLSRTELVVLNCCQSGNGDFKLGEGITGFRRAFSLAGVKYVLSTLNPLDDINGVLFTKVFYTKYNESRNVEKAYKDTKLYLKSGAAIRDLLSLQPLFNDEWKELGFDEPHPIMKEKIFESQRNHNIMTKRDGKWVKENWSIFVLHRC